MHYKVEFLQACRRQAKWIIEQEAINTEQAVMQCNKWLPGLWVRVTNIGTSIQIIYIMKPNGTLEPVF